MPAFAAACLSLTAHAAMTVESLTGPVTQNEIDSFKSYILTIEPVVYPDTGSIENQYAQAASGEQIKGMGLMYEITKDRAILDRMIYFCDKLLSQRNDILPAPYGQKTYATGQIEPAWTGQRDDVTPYSTSASGDCVGHLAYCARLILQTPAILSLNVSGGDPYGNGATYGARAATYIAECDYTVDNYFLPNMLDLSHSNQYYYSASSPYQTGQNMPWNQQMMMSYGFSNLAWAHQLLGDSPSRVSQYDGIVQANANWFFTNSATKTVYTDSKGNTAYDWGYPPAYNNGEDNNHGSLDVAGFYRLYLTGRYGITAAQLTPMANAICDVLTRTVGSDYAGRINGTDGTGHAAPTTYLRSGYFFMAEFRPDQYTNMVTGIRLSAGASTTSTDAFSRFCWIKNLRAGGGTVAAPVFSPGPGTYAAAQSVSITSATSGATIRYTTDGSTPTSSVGTVYSGPVSIGSTTTLKAIAYKTGMTNSAVTSGTYTISAGGGGVTATSGDGLHNTAFATQTGTFTATFDWVASVSPINSLVALSTSAPTAYTGCAVIIRFNPSGLIDARNGGAYAAVSSIPYSGGVTYHFRIVTNVTAHTYSAYVTAPGGSEQTIATNYAFRTEQASVTSLVWWSVAADPTPTGSTTVTNFALGSAGAVAAPTFSPGGGTYTSAQTVTISTTTSGATIRYTVDGSTPTSTTGTVYSAPVSITATKTLKAIAYKSGMTDSAVTSATYTITATPAKITVPSASVTASTYTSTYVPANTVDGSLSTRWAASGDGVWIQYDLGATKTVAYVKLAWYLGDTRTYTFDVQVATSASGPWTTVVAGRTNAANTSLQTVDFTDTSARYVRVVGHLSSVDSYTNVTEAEIWGY